MIQYNSDIGRIIPQYPILNRLYNCHIFVNIAVGLIEPMISNKTHIPAIQVQFPIIYLLM